MRILISSDLHDKTHFYRWMAKHAVSYDLVCLAGDYLNCFSRDYGNAQVKRFNNLAKEISVNTPLAFCLGNHDSRFERDIRVGTRELKGFPILGIHGNKIFPGPTVEASVIVTAMPYRMDGFVDQIFLKEGFRLKETMKAPWIVLHHEPPLYDCVSDFGGNVFIRGAMDMFKPDFIVSGHIHELPYKLGPQGFAQKTDHTWCLNPGRLGHHPIELPPNHIILDTVERTATWRFVNLEMKSEESTVCLGGYPEWLLYIPTLKIQMAKRLIQAVRPSPLSLRG